MTSRPSVFGIFGGNLHRFGVKPRLRVADDVHRIVVAPCRGQDFIEGIHRFGRQVGQLCAAGDEGVGGNHARPPGIGHDRQTRSAGTWLLRQHFRHVEQFGNGVHPQNAHALKGRLKHFIAPG